MRKLVIGAATAAFLGTAGPAAAGGMYEGEGSLKDAPAPLPPVALWAGLYFGGSVGFGVGDATGQIDIDDPDDPDDLEFLESLLSSDFDVDGAVYGAHLGYNWQDGNLVVGAEAAINGTDIDGRERCGAGLIIPLCEREVDLNYYATLVGRLGYAVNNFLFYGFGGLAWGDVDTTLDITDGIEDEETVSLFNDSTSHLGWTAGAGIEFAFNERFSAGVEYAHVDLGEEDITGDFDALGAPEGVTFRDEVDMQFDVIKIRASYKLWHRRRAPLESYK